MIKPSLDKIGYFVLGVVATGTIMTLDQRKDNDAALQTMLAGIENGDFCAASSEETESIKADAEEIFFVGCGGFF